MRALCSVVPRATSTKKASSPSADYKLFTAGLITSMAKILAEGKKQTGPPFVQLFHYVIESGAYRALSMTARAALVEIAWLYHGDNNGRLAASSRWLADRLNSSKSTAARATIACMSRITIRPATPADATHLACFVDMASGGMVLRLWEAMRRPGQTLFEAGRSRALREEGSFSYRNAHIAELDGEVAGALVGYRIAEVHDGNYRTAGDPNAPPLPAFIAYAPLVPRTAQRHALGLPDARRIWLELESMVPGHWYVNILATYPEHRGHGIGRALLANAEVLAAAADAKGMAVVVASENEGAWRLYESVGYVRKASRPRPGVPGAQRGGDWMLLTKAGPEPP